VLVMGYSEPLFLCLAVAAFIWMKQGKWWWVAGAGFLAGLTRPVGLLLLVPIVIVAARGGTRGPVAARLAAVLAPLAGTAAFLGWVGARFGDPMLPFRVQNLDGLRGHTVSPLSTAAHAVAGLLTGETGQQLHYLWIVAAIALVVVVLLQWPPEYGAYAALTVLAALSAQHLGSFERYAYGAFPLVLAGASLTRSARVERVVLVLSGAAMGAYAVAAFVGAYVP
jgi:hypothetical protein